MVTISKMTDDDLSEVVRRGLETPELHTDTESAQFYSKETLSRWIKSTSGVTLVARDGDKLIGFCLTSYNPDTKDGYIHDVMVDEKFRGQGVASRMLEQMTKRLKEIGCNHVWCLVQEENEGMLKFLEKHGFEVGRSFKYVERMLP